MMISGKECKTQKCQVNTRAGRQWRDRLENVGWRYARVFQSINYTYSNLTKWYADMSFMWFCYLGMENCFRAVPGGEGPISTLKFKRVE